MPFTKKQSAAYRQRLALRGLCLRCRAPAAHASYCPACVAWRKAWKRAAYHARKDAGACTRCGGEAVVGPLCQVCRRRRDKTYAKAISRLAGRTT